MSSSTDTVNLLKAIIEHLAQAPFNRTESLISFSQQTPQQLLQLLNDIAAQLDERHQIDLSTETSDVTAHRLIDFVCVTLDYHPDDAADFGRDLIAGTTRVVYPLFYHLLSRFLQLKQRAYLARYVRPFECPAEYAADPVMSALIQQYHDKQWDFKEKHKNVTKLRENATNVHVMKTDMKQLENEKLQLINKLNKIKDRISIEHADDFEQNDHHHGGDDDDEDHILHHDDDNTDDHNNNGNHHHRSTSAHGTPLTAEGRYLADMISATKALRHEQEAENKLYQQKMNQLQNIEKYSKLSNESDQALSQLKQLAKNANNNNNNNNNNTTTDPTRLLTIMSRDVNNQRTYITDELQPLLNTQEKSVKKIQSLLSSTAYTSDDLVEMSNNNKVLLNQIENLTEQIENIHSSDGGRIALIRDRYNNIIKKNNIILQEISDLEIEKKEILDENDLILNKIENFQKNLTLNQNNNLNENDIKLIINQLSQQTNDYKKNKKDLENLNSELEILNSTFLILKNQCSNFILFQENLEKNHNLIGFKSLNNQLETLSLNKNNLDLNKLQTLDEISEIIIMIKEKLKNNKDILAPKIKNLRNLRSNYELIEKDFLLKKKDENLRDLNFSTEREILKKENNSVFLELNNLQNLFFNLNNQILILNAREITLKDANKTIINSLETFIKENESIIHLLKKDKKLVKDKPADLSHQSEYFLMARNILQSKIQEKEGQINEMERTAAAAAAAATTTAGGAGFGGGGMNGGYGGTGRGGSDVYALAADADRLVFD